VRISPPRSDSQAAGEGGVPAFQASFEVRIPMLVRVAENLYRVWVDRSRAMLGGPCVVILKMPLRSSPGVYRTVFSSHHADAGFLGGGHEFIELAYV
jgi:hypothetical protein